MQKTNTIPIGRAGILEADGAGWVDLQLIMDMNADRVFATAGQGDAAMMPVIRVRMVSCLNVVELMMRGLAALLHTTTNKGGFAETALANQLRTTLVPTRELVFIIPRHN